jgi:hypothetical protein
MSHPQRQAAPPGTTRPIAWWTSAARSAQMPTHQSRTDPDARLYRSARDKLPTVLRRARRYGETAWPVGLSSHEWHRRMCGSARLDRWAERTTLSSSGARAGQELRHAGLGRQAARQAHHAARRPERRWSAECHRRAADTARGYGISQRIRMKDGGRSSAG